MRVIADTGPLVAYCYGPDRHHDWAVRTLQGLRPPLLCCEAVLTELFWRVAYLGGNTAQIWAWLEQDIIRIEFSVAEHYADLRRLMQRYANRKMDFADACLVRMSELHREARVFTCDRDFKVYRRNERQQIPLIFPD